MLVIGLTGGIGSGKTAVAKLFAEHGVTIIDTDELARELTQPGQDAFNVILDHFGLEILMDNGHLNRKTLRKIIFVDPKKRIWLENLLHPLIRQKMAKLIKEAKSPYCMAVIPLLLESKPNPLINRILVIDSLESDQIKRVSARDKHTFEEVKAIMKTQFARADRLAAADDLIYNTEKLEDLIPQVEKLHLFYLSLS